MIRKKMHLNLGKLGALFFFSLMQHADVGANMTLMLPSSVTLGMDCLKSCLKGRKNSQGLKSVIVQWLVVY